jgi:hypothetical protein
VENWFEKHDLAFRSVRNVVRPHDTTFRWNKGCPMNRLLAIAVVVVALGWATNAQAQLYTTYYAPAPVTTYYAPTTAYYAPAPVVARAPVVAPVTTYYAPVAYPRPILGGYRYRYAPVAAYPAVSTSFYYPGY